MLLTGLVSVWGTRLQMDQFITIKKLQDQSNAIGIHLSSRFDGIWPLLNHWGCNPYCIPLLGSKQIEYNGTYFWRNIHDLLRHSYSCPYHILTHSTIVMCYSRWCCLWKACGNFSWSSQLLPRVGVNPTCETPSRSPTGGGTGPTSALQAMTGSWIWLPPLINEELLLQLFQQNPETDALQVCERNWERLDTMGAFPVVRCEWRSPGLHRFFPIRTAR